LTHSWVSSRSRRTKAIDLPSGEGVGRTAPPNPMTAVTVTPVSMSSRSIANVPWSESCAYSKVPPGVTLRVK